MSELDHQPVRKKNQTNATYRLLNPDHLLGDILAGAAHTAHGKEHVVLPKNIYSVKNYSDLVKITSC